MPTNLLLKADFAAEKRETVIDAVSLKALDSNQEEVSKPAIEIPDNFLQDTADGKEWILPASEKEPSLSFDFTGLDPQKRSQPIVYSIDVFSGPDGGRYRAGNTAAGVFKALLDSAKNPISTYTDEAKQIPLTHIFTKPGLYALDFNVETSDKNGNFSYSGKKIYFAVGNETIKQLRLIAAENGKLRADLPDLPDTAQDSPAEPAVTDIETESSADLPGANTAEDSSKKLHLIRSGHIDQALSYDGSTAKVFADDTADPRNPILRPSNTFAYAVPNSAHTLIPADAEGFSEIRAASPQGVWALPETQQQDLPWVGFSTQRVDYSLLDPKKV
ncbi:choice-of-anchor M domain-containing protein [Arcanobacterium hippocoleae]